MKRFQVIATFESSTMGAMIPVGQTEAETAANACLVAWANLGELEKQTLLEYRLSAREVTDDEIAKRELWKLPISDARNPNHDIFLQCAEAGHLPYANSGHGGNSMVYGCWCGHIKTNKPFPYYQPVTHWPGL